MKKLLLSFVVLSFVLLGEPLPAHAQSTGEATGSFVGSGYWGNRLTQVPTHMEIGYNAVSTGVFSVDDAVRATALSCTGIGRGTEALQSGSGTVVISCSGPDVSLTSTQAISYQRTGTETIVNGPARLAVGGRSILVTIALVHTVTPLSTSAFTAEGTLHAARVAP